jgi:hypothetical protein
MSVKIIERDKRPEISPENQNDKPITLSRAQHDCYLADPADFVVLQPAEGVNAATPAHNQCGRDESEYRALLKKGTADKGKSPFRKP